MISDDFSNSLTHILFYSNVVTFAMTGEGLSTTLSILGEDLLMTLMIIVKPVDDPVDLVTTF